VSRVLAQSLPDESHILDLSMSCGPASENKELAKGLAQFIIDSDALIESTRAMRRPVVPDPDRLRHPHRSASGRSRATESTRRCTSASRPSPQPRPARATYSSSCRRPRTWIHARRPLPGRGERTRYALSPLTPAQPPARAEGPSCRRLGKARRRRNRPDDEEPRDYPGAPRSSYGDGGSRTANQPAGCIV
jgi:hypothetical protein